MRPEHDIPPETRPIRVLVLDDEPMILMGLRHTFISAGFEPICARSCAKALKAIDERSPDVAILDVNLGHETCEVVAHRLRKRQVPFALHTGDLDRQGERVTRLAAAILAKPSFPETIVQVVQNLHRDRTETSSEEFGAKVR